MKGLIVLMIVALVAGCKSLPPQQCSATANIGGHEATVPIYGVRTQANQTQYYAGNPFGWTWVSKSNFTKSSCER